MKKLTGLLIVFSLLLLVCICVPQFSDAQKLKPGVKGINKPGISKPTAKKPGLSNSIKSKLPALEVSRLALDSGCNITGYIQNKGASISATHSDFFKIEVKVGYILNGKTKEVVLKTRQASNKSQPLLLVGAATLRNFIQGRSAKFTSKLQVPSTGKGFATVFAEIDPDNKIRETRTGEQKKRIQARLRSGCAPRGPGSIKVNPPKRIGEADAASTARIAPPPAGSGISVATNHAIYQDHGIKVTHPKTPMVRDNVTIKYQFPRSSSPPDRIMIYLYQFCKNLSPRDLPIDRIYDGPPLASHRVNLSTIDFSSVRCPGEVKFFFAVFEVGEVGETVTDRREGHSRHFTYFSNTFVKPAGSKKLMPGKNKIDPDTKKKIGILPSTKANDGVIKILRSINFISPTLNQVITREDGLTIPVEFNYSGPIDEGGAVILYELWASNAEGVIAKRITSPYFQRSDSIVREGGRFGISLSHIPESDLHYNSYEIMMYTVNSFGTIARGVSESFKIDDGRLIPGSGDWEVGIDPEPVSNGIEIGLPMMDGVYFISDEFLNIRYTLNSSCARDGSTADFDLEEWRPPHNVVASVRKPIDYRSAELPIDGRVSTGSYRIIGSIKDSSGREIGTGSSGIFRLESRGATSRGGIEITSPTRHDWYRNSSHDLIVVSFDTGNCEQAITHGIKIKLFHFVGTTRVPYILIPPGLPTEGANTMLFEFPSGSLGEDPTGLNTNWQIEITPNGVGDVPSNCYDTSDTFRMSY